MKKDINNKGITLISLIITIVILIILAVTTIAAIKGDGIITQADMSVTVYSREQAKEKIYLALKEFEINKYNPTSTKTLGEFLEEKFEEDGKDYVSYDETADIYTVKINGHEFYVNEQGVNDSYLPKDPDIDQEQDCQHNNNKLYWENGLVVCQDCREMLYYCSHNSTGNDPSGYTYCQDCGLRLDCSHNSTWNDPECGNVHCRDCGIWLYCSHDSTYNDPNGYTYCTDCGEQQGQWKGDSALSKCEKHGAYDCYYCGF